MDVLRPLADVDGHDFGSGARNIFVLADNPATIFDLVLPLLEKLARERDVTVAYRAVTGEEYTAVWPQDSAEKFSIA